METELKATEQETAEPKATEQKATVQFLMASGDKHEFEMMSDKAMAFVQYVTHCNPNDNKKWIDVWDYTGRTKGQFVIDSSKIESLLISPDAYS